jgi:5-formaminoimidazole-4-carboxamide-1-beta-D-ribofuranosyl 5'-monophosphate synthetase
MEDAEWIFDERHGWQTLQVAEKQQEEFHKNWKKIDEEVAITAFRKFLSSL